MQPLTNDGSKNYINVSKCTQPTKLYVDIIVMFSDIDSDKYNTSKNLPLLENCNSSVLSYQISSALVYKHSHIYIFRAVNTDGVYNMSLMV